MSDDGANRSAIYPFKKQIGPLRFSKSIIQTDDLTRYLTRYIIEFGERRSSIRLHIFTGPDHDPCFHDHPWWFVTFVLWGGYVERFAGKFGEQRECKVRWFGFRPRMFRHRITTLLRKTVVTLIITGPIEREWGFYTDNGWMNWKVFTKVPFSTRLPWCSTYEDKK